MRTLTTKRMAVISIMTCVTAVCSWITVPSAVPFTMQTFAVFCALLLLGGRDGTIAVGLYILLGCAGLPVFSGFQSGVGHILGPTGGYIVGFILTALCYFAFEPALLKNDRLKAPVLVLGLALCYAAGTYWFRYVMGLRGAEYSINAVLSLCVLPYIVPDLVKLALAMYVCRRVRGAIDLGGAQ